MLSKLSILLLLDYQMASLRTCVHSLQTVYDPTASLSAERRGALSLPDVEKTYTAVSSLFMKAKFRGKHYCSCILQILLSAL